MTQLVSGLRIDRIGAGDAELVSALFSRIRADAAAAQFHPHEFSDLEAAARASYAGPDFYAIMVLNDEAIGYGLLRGWQLGFKTPSLGIYIAEGHRRIGAARLLMQYLHLVAKLKGSQAVRLKVYHDNVRAISLYRSLGYRFSETLETGQLVGSLPL